MIKQRITNCLWFDTEAEEAANFYTSIFKNSKIGKIARYGKVGVEIHGKEPGSVMSVEFDLDGQTFLALNGGPDFKFNEAISLIIHCESQDEIDYYWDRLTKDGKEVQCGWLEDKFGVSWQVVPDALSEMLSQPDNEKSQRVTQAFFQMKKLDLRKLQEEFEK